MTYQLAILGVLVALAVILVIVYLIRHERDAWLGRQLRGAAGSEHAARLAIESANLDRLLSQKYENEYERAMRHKGNRLPRNVVRLVPRVTNRGRTVNFTPDGDAA